MQRTWLKVTWLPLWSALVACSTTPAISARDAADANDTGQTVRAKNGTERDVLARLPKLPTGSPQLVGELSVTAGAPYAAASGRWCRSLELSSVASHQTSHRLACATGGSWFFVPDVFASPVAE